MVVNSDIAPRTLLAVLSVLPVAPPSLSVPSLHPISNIDAAVALTCDAGLRCGSALEPTIIYHKIHHENHKM